MRQQLTSQISGNTEIYDHMIFMDNRRSGGKNFEYAVHDLGIVD